MTAASDALMLHWIVSACRECGWDHEHGRWLGIRRCNPVCTLHMSVILAPPLDLRRVRIRDLVLSPVLAELLQLPAPASGPSHPASPQGGPDTSAALPVTTADRQEADGTIPTVRLPSGGAEGTGIGRGDCASEDDDCGDDGSWFAPCTAARLVDLFHDLVGDRGLLLSDDLVRWVVTPVKHNAGYITRGIRTS